MLSKIELEFLKSPENFSTDYARVFRHLIKAKTAQLRSELALLDVPGLSVTENCNGATEFCNGQQNQQSPNQADFLKTEVKIGAFGGIWTRDHYLTKVTPHRARLRRRFMLLP